jgi:hypothetical protein
MTVEMPRAHIWQIQASPSDVECIRIPPLTLTEPFLLRAGGNAVNLAALNSSPPRLRIRFSAAARTMEYLIAVFLALLLSSNVLAEEPTTLTDPPPYKLLRAEEDYSYLSNDGPQQYKEDWSDPIKLIRLASDRDIYLTLGGEFRPRYEHFTNRTWVSEDDEGFYSQRLSMHAKALLGRRVRLFAEFYHGYNGGEKEFAQFDEFDWHQGFVEVIPRVTGRSDLRFRLGRQEMAFGAARLVGIREGPNIRRSFDAIRVIHAINSTTLQGFYGREVRPEFDALDNDFVFFDGDSDNPELWGAYSQFDIPGDVGTMEAYYLGFRSPSSIFNDVTGEERRQTIGIRRFGTIGHHWQYNTELIYQFGEISGEDIRAYNVETDWHLRFSRIRWEPSVGLKLELTSGDNRPGDGRINSFNPMFVNPSYYSLSGVITPVNMISIHPSLALHPKEKLRVYIEWAIFRRDSSNDGLYSPPRFLARDGAGVSERHIGTQLGLKIEYELDRHVSFELESSYFVAGDFLRATGESENILHVAPTLSIKF